LNIYFIYYLFCLLFYFILFIFPKPYIYGRTQDHVISRGQRVLDHMSKECVAFHQMCRTLGWWRKVAQDVLCRVSSGPLGITVDMCII
jgi:hypothetical protein